MHSIQGLNRCLLRPLFNPAHYSHYLRVSTLPTVLLLYYHLSDVLLHHAAQFNRSFLHQLFNLAHDLRIFAQRGPLDILRGISLASVFYEPSTRTSCSFTAAMQKLGGTVLSLSDMQATSVAKGETLQDFMRVMERYSHIVYGHLL